MLHFSQPLLVVFLALLALYSRHRDPIQISHTRLRYPPSTLRTPNIIRILVDLFDYAQLLQRLQDLSVYRAGRIDVV